MNDNKRFDDILSVCLDRILKGDTVEKCLESYPDQARELEPLLRTATAARIASGIRPRTEFKTRARYEFQSALRQIEPKKSNRSLFTWLRPQWQSGWAIAVIAVLIIVAAGGSTVAAASNSMPDSVLYPVKLATEKAQMTLTFSDVAKAELNAEFANKRVDEIIYMASKGDAEEVLVVAGLLNNNLENISNLIKEDTVSADGSARNDGTNNDNNKQPPILAASQPAPSPNMAPENTSVPAFSSIFGSSVPEVLSPEPGASNVAVSPLFSWPVIDGATGYDLQIADNPDFQNPIVSLTNLQDNSWQPGEPLESSTIYYWRYRDFNNDTGAVGEWIQNAFTTWSEPAIKANLTTPTLPLITLTVPPGNPSDIQGENKDNLSSMEKLKQKIIEYAITHQARLEDALAKAPAEVRPALRQAISRALDEYSKLVNEFENVSTQK